MKKISLLLMLVIAGKASAWCPKGYVNVELLSALFDDDGFHSIETVVSDGQRFAFKWGDHGDGGAFWLCAKPGATLTISLFQQQECQSRKPRVVRLVKGDVAVHDDLTTIHNIQIHEDGDLLSCPFPSLISDRVEPAILKNILPNPPVKKSKCSIM